MRPITPQVTRFITPDGFGPPPWEEAFLKGVHVPAMVMGGRELGSQGLMMDTRKRRWDSEKRALAAALVQDWRGAKDLYSKDLMCLAPPDQLIPPASSFISIGAASPFFRQPTSTGQSELLVYHKDISEAPWTEQSFLSTKGISFLDEQEIREGSFVRLYDPSLAQITNGRDSAVLFGHINRFIGFSRSQVTALVDILTFYRHNHLASYRYGNPINPGVRLHEQAIIILSQPRCQFEPGLGLAMLKYGEEALEVKRAHTFFPEQHLVGWGPARAWHGNSDWEAMYRSEEEGVNEEEKDFVLGRDIPSRRTK